MSTVSAMKLPRFTVEAPRFSVDGPATVSRARILQDICHHNQIYPEDRFSLPEVKLLESPEIAFSRTEIKSPSITYDANVLQQQVQAGLALDPERYSPFQSPHILVSDPAIRYLAEAIVFLEVKFTDLGFTMNDNVIEAVYRAAFMLWWNHLIIQMESVGISFQIPEVMSTFLDQTGIVNLDSPNFLILLRVLERDYGRFELIGSTGMRPTPSKLESVDALDLTVLVPPKYYSDTHPKMVEIQRLMYELGFANLPSSVGSWATLRCDAAMPRIHLAPIYQHFQQQSDISLIRHPLVQLFVQAILDYGMQLDRIAPFQCLPDSIQSAIVQACLIQFLHEKCRFGKESVGTTKFRNCFTRYIGVPSTAYTPDQMVRLLESIKPAYPAAQGVRRIENNRRFSNLAIKP